MAKKPVSYGDRVEDFTLSSSRGGRVNTASFKGKKILLSFHPSAWSPVCAKQMQAIDAAYAEFEKLNTIPLGISVDSLTSLAAWARSLKLTKLHLLADFWPHGETAKKLGVFIKKAGISTRANIILGKKRKVIFCRVYSLSHAPDVKELIEFLKKKIVQDAKDSAKEQEKKPAPGKRGAGKPAVKKPAAGKS